VWRKFSSPISSDEEETVSIPTPRQRLNYTCKSKFESTFPEGYEPAAQVSNCAEAISNAALPVFGVHIKRVHRRAHVIQNVNKNLSKVKFKKLRDSIR
jgi:hypothetical protein